MPSHLTIMRGDKPSTKIYRVEGGVAVKGKVQQAYLHDSTTVEGLDNIVDLFTVLSEVRKDPRAYIMRGAGVEPKLKGVRRLKLNEHSDNEGKFAEVPTQWVCLDFDAYDVPHYYDRNSVAAIEWIIKTVLPPEFQKVSYIYQFSSSSGIEYNGKPVKHGTNCHLFYWLSRAVSDVELKHWLTPAIEKGVDDSVFNTVTPIHVGSHVILKDGVVDTLAPELKFDLVVKEEPEVTVPTITAPVFSSTVQVISSDLQSDIIRELHSLGAYYKRSGQWIKLKHPLEKTAGDWHIRASDPCVVHHHVHKSMRVDNWIKQFYGKDVKFDFPRPDNKSREELLRKLAEKVKQLTN